MLLDLVTHSDQRVDFIGQTGMGKTFLAEHLLAQQKRVIVVDPKHRVAWKGYHVTSNPVAALLEPKVIYRPKGGNPPEEWWWEAVQRLNEDGGGVLYVDEGAFVSGPNKIPKGLSDGIRLGRELGVGIWVAAQESVTIHNTILRQADVVISFYNQGASDREKLATIMGDMAHTTAHLPKYHFVVFVRGETYDHEAVPTYMVSK